MNVIEQIMAEGLVDSHYHIGPELIPRRYNVATLAVEAVKHHATIVLKNHTYSTTPLAALARSQFGAKFLGGIVLNHYVGGLNADAIYAAASGNSADNAHVGSNNDPTFVVWMPTIHAEAHLKTLGCAFDPRWHDSCCGTHDTERHFNHKIEKPVLVFDNALQAKPELIDVLEAIVETKACLATGHLSAREVECLVPLALEMGVRRIIITHPDYPATQLSVEALQRLTKDPSVYIEYCFAVTTIESVPIETIADNIVRLNPEQIMIASDFGQMISDAFPEGTFIMIEKLLSALNNRLSQDTVVNFFTANPKKALFLAGDTYEKK